MFSLNTPYPHTITNFMYKVYAWMFIGLLVTATTSYAMLAHPTLLIQLVSSPLSFYGLIGAQLGLVIYLMSCLSTMSYNAAMAAFLTYSGLVGITLAPLFLLYTTVSVTLTFISAACMFGAMALYGYTTNTDLTQFRSILFMGLVGIIIAGFANWFFGSSSLELMISAGGILLFTALTAYDVQKIKLLARSMAYTYEEAPVNMVDKRALMAALQLYLDFINLFIYLLRFAGKRRK